MQSQAFQVRQGLQGVGQQRQLRSRQGQGVAAGQNHLMDAGIGSQVVDGFLPLAGGCRFFAVREVTPETVAAIDGAGSGGDQKRPALVFVQYPGCATGRQIADRIDAEAGRQLFFLGERQNLPQQRVVDVAMAHFGGETARNPEREGLPGIGRNPVRKARQTEHFQQFQRVAQAVAPQLLPVRDLSGEGFGGYHRRLERS